MSTRALLGEGWDCPAVNCLVDLGVAATGVSVQQARGRSLRLDPEDPHKLSSNWDVVCVAPDLARGSADYERFVRRHLHLYAPAEDGEIEAGPSHVHPELGPFAPPPAERFAAVNRDMLARVRSREQARERWRIGAPYRGAELRTVVRAPARARAPRRGDRRAARVRPAADLPAAAARRRRRRGRGGGRGRGRRRAGGVRRPRAGARGRGLGGMAAAPGARPAAARAAAGPGGGRDRRRLQGARRDVRRGRRLARDRAAHQRLRALRADRRHAGGERALLRPRSRSCRASPTTRATSSAARCPSPASAPARCSGACSRAGRRSPSGCIPCPSDLGRHKDRAEAFARAWRRRLGPGRLVFTQRSDEGREARASVAGEDGGYETLVRDVWV